MISAITSTFVKVPAAAFSGIIGAVVSLSVFNKLTHIAEYTLNKTLGDYQNPRKTLDDRIIVTANISKNYFCIQNIVLSTLVAAISWKAVQILASIGCPAFIATPFLVGCVAVPIFIGLSSMYLIPGQTGDFRGRWVEISEAETNKHGINKIDVKRLERGENVYCNFGSVFKYFPGELISPGRA